MAEYIELDHNSAPSTVVVLNGGVGVSETATTSHYHPSAPTLGLVSPVYK